MQFFSDFCENTKKFQKKWKIGLNDIILDFEGQYPVISPLIFSWFFEEVSEQSDQVARKPDFWLRSANNDSKQKDES